jgi:prepilin-type N-terminal cleavage/methylation domain-containing protein
MFFKTKNHRGFTLIELMIVVAIIAILAAVAVSNFMVYSKKATVAQCVETVGSLRGALASYAVDSRGNGYPKTAEIPDWATFRSLCNANGATLKTTLLEQGFNSFAYHGVNKVGGVDTCDNDVPGNECSDYLIMFEVAGVQHDMIGSRIIVTSPGTYRQSF